MRDSSFLSEQELAVIEGQKNPDAVPHLVSTIRTQQHELDGLRLSMEVARRDREELRSALISAHAEIDRLRASTAAPERARPEDDR
jgi:hypothetical protein